MLVLAASLALLPSPAVLNRPIALGRRGDRVSSRFSPAYDTTVRYAAADWAKNVRTLPQSLILKRISSPLLFNVLITSVVCALHTNLRALPPLLPLPHTLLGSALGLLLVFRTNAAYDRFWEARKQWGIVTSECRSLASLACTFMTPQQALPLLSLTAAFPVVMKNYLRGGSSKSQERDVRRLKALLAPQEFGALSAVINQPQFIIARLQQLSQASKIAGVSEKEREMLLKSSNVLGSCVSTCERIYNTPIPLACALPPLEHRTELHWWGGDRRRTPLPRPLRSPMCPACCAAVDSRHTSRFLVLYVSTLPLVLVGSLRWITLPVMATVCWALFGILEIGNLVEEPFGAITDAAATPLLPLTEVCRTIRRDVRAVAQYAQLGREYMVPTIQVRPEAVAVPESFRQLRRLVGFNASKNGTNGTHANATGAVNGTKVFIGEASIKAKV